MALACLMGLGCGRQVLDAVRLTPDGGSGGSGSGDSGSATGGSSPDAADCGSDASAVCGPTIWPNELSRTNSDAWLRTNHDRLTEMRPNVLLLDFYNGSTVAEVGTLASSLVAGISETSRFHGYTDATAPAFLNYQIAKVVDLTDHPAPAGTRGSSLLPRDAQGNFDAGQLFGAAYAERYAIPDPTRVGHNLTLCEVFERGVVNEVWMAVGEDPPRGPLIMERKQMYDATGTPLPGQFQPCAGNEQGTCLMDPAVTCAVTVRLAHLSPVRPIGCDIEIRGLPFESQGTRQAVPYLDANASAFYNKDFRKFGVAFNSWYDICGEGTTTCVTYPTTTRATGSTSDGAWNIDPFDQGCGSVRFPANARYRNDFSNAAPIQARCEHFGMGDGVGGKDVEDLFGPDKLAKFTQTFGSGATSCGGSWQVYLRQSMPGFRNTARDRDGKPMKNWWPFLFY